MKIPRVYVAGSYTAATRKEREANAERAAKVGELVIKAGGYPVIPHLVGIRLEHVEKPYEWWIETTMRELQTCDACVMVPGWHRSNGSKSEYEDCLRKSRPVFELNLENADAPFIHWFELWLSGWQACV